MKREDRLSAGMTPEKVSQVYAILKARFEERRKKLRELEEREMKKTLVKNAGSRAKLKERREGLPTLLSRRGLEM